MTETQHPSELESFMDNLEALTEAVSVARQKVRERQRRAVPNRAPQRPGAERDDQVWDEDGSDVDSERDDQAWDEDGSDVDSERAEENIEGSEGTSAELEAEGTDARRSVGRMSEAARQEVPLTQASQGMRGRPVNVEQPLPAASEEVRLLMAEMAVERRHTDEIQAAGKAAGAGWEYLLDDPVARHRVYRAAAEMMVDKHSATSRQAQEVLRVSGLRDLAVHDAEGEALNRELRQVQVSEADGEKQAAAFADRIALVQMQQGEERVEQTQQAQRAERDGTEFVSEVRLPLMVGGTSLAAVYGDSAIEAAQQYVQQELGARLEGDELVIPVAGEGTDVEASVDPTVSAWRSVTAEELVLAAGGGPEPTNLAYLYAASMESSLVGPDGEVRASGAESGQIRPTEDGLTVEAGISNSDVSPVVWERLTAEFGEPEEGTLFVPVSADPHADPVAAIDSARADLPGSLFAAHEDYEQQLLARRDLAEAQADPGVWVQPASEDAYVDLVEKQRPEGGVEAMVWVDEQQRPTTHPEGVPSVWFDEDGQPAAFGHYEEGQPSGTWAWTDPESGTFASDRAEMSAEGPVSGTQQHRDSPEDGWTTVGEESSGASSEAAEPGEVGLDAASPTAEPSPSPGPRHDPSTPPMPDPSGPSRGPRLH
jgi:hypothetical protein